MLISEEDGRGKIQLEGDRCNWYRNWCRNIVVGGQCWKEDCVECGLIREVFWCVRGATIKIMKKHAAISRH